MNNQDLKIGFVGGGNMARAMAGGLIRAGHVPACLAVAEPDAGQRRLWAGLHRDISTGASNAVVAGAARVLVLAVKPQVLPAVAGELSGVPRPADQLIMSVAAGISLASIARSLRSEAPMVRIMPNQPALIGEGMSAMFASAGVSEVQKAQALYIAEATGRALWVSDEALMDAVTAISGSGPAYFYLLMELMEKSAVELGLPGDVAQALVRQTALGAARTAAASPAPGLEALRASVTSPGGTTAAALSVLEQAGIADILRRALLAARDRGRELGKSSG